MTERVRSKASKNKAKLRRLVKREQKFKEKMQDEPEQNHNVTWFVIDNQTKEIIGIVAFLIYDGSFWFNKKLTNALTGDRKFHYNNNNNGWKKVAGGMPILMQQAVQFNFDLQIIKGEFK